MAFPLGDVTTRTEAVGLAEQRAETFTYDGMRRLRTSTDGVGGKTTTAYDLSGNKLQSIDPTGIQETWVYDSRERGQLRRRSPFRHLIAIEAALGELETNRRFIIATIGSFKKSGTEYNGSITTLSVQTKNVRIVPEETRSNDNAPSHRVFCGPHKCEIGAASGQTLERGPRLPWPQA